MPFGQEAAASIPVQGGKTHVAEKFTLQSSLGNRRYTLIYLLHAIRGLHFVERANFVGDVGISYN